MSCWTLLGLPPTVDTRTIKRHYARLLKQTRPDEDPQGFQQLREAYEQALDQAHWLSSEDDLETPPQATAADDWPALQQQPQQSPAQRVAPLLEGIRIDQLDQRHQQAIDTDCLLEFELGLLRHCVERPEQSVQLLAWAFATFHWLSAWQRLELPDYLLEALLQGCRQALEQPLFEALQQQDGAAFVQHYAQRSQHVWLNSLDQRQWFNQRLVVLLLDSPYWLTEVFEAVCAGQGWQAGDDNACPALEWERLLARHEAPQFIARQQALAAEPLATAEQRAAYLLLAPISFSRRRAFARRLRSDDWASCRQLSSRLHANHPEVSAGMPGGTAFFWRDWEFAFDAWPMYLGIIIASLAGAFARYAPQASSLEEIIGVALFWSACFAAFAALLWWLWQPLAHRLWARDQQLSSRLPHWLDRQCDVLILQDLLPAVLLGAVLGYFCGAVSGATYLLVLLGIAIGRRRELKVRAPWEQADPWQRRLLIGLGCMVLVAALSAIKLASNYGTVTANQGLQQWSERLCARMPIDASECAVPATVEQWYGKEDGR
ncbi:molecular chaperone DnaJ [Pseudomonas sp. Fl5BN2]|uniref:J domain-containing protein n=1 Tax=Pseudomonas sp. Fl5BN2 TaxID=2697652 RepID=UPI0013790965|nr:J domain-containing protein [Pseudomonas sp. Fl5BN2]NBF02138.1 molecular chaperone DnaJ [Pseudomonas sp. Fl5BN2]